MTTTEVLGTGVYLEARRIHNGTTYTAQIIFLPEVVAGVTRTPMTMIHRRLTSAFPKKTWKQYMSGATAPKALLTGPAVEASTTQGKLDIAAWQVASFALKHMETLAKADYKAVGDPAYFQYTREDAEAVRIGKTPYKVIGRINKLRKEFKYPEDLIVR
jgi:hypothetical protein